MKTFKVLLAFVLAAPLALAEPEKKDAADAPAKAVPLPLRTWGKRFSPVAALYRRFMRRA